MQWSNVIPKETGCYWMFGKPWGAKNMELRFVRVRNTKLSAHYICEGNFIYAEDMKNSFWMEIE